MGIPSAEWLSELRGAAARVTSRDAFTRDVVPLLADGFDASLAMHYRTQASGQLETLGPLAALMETYNRGFRAGDPLQHAKRYITRRVAVISDLVDRRTLRRSQVYNELYRRTEVEHHLSLRLTPSSYGTPGTEAVVLVRGPTQPAFESAHLDAAQHAMGSLVAAARRIRRLEELEATVETLETLLDGFAARPFAVFDLHGKLLFASQQARDVLRRAGESVLVPELELAVRHYVAAGLGGGEARSRFVSSAARIAVSGELTTLTRRLGDGVVVLWLDAVVVEAEMNARLVERYGLSRAELRVARSLVRGQTNAQIAEELFLSQHTVRSHLRAIFRKVGVASRTQAVLVLLQGGSGDDA